MAALSVQLATANKSNYHHYKAFNQLQSAIKNEDYFPSKKVVKFTDLQCNRKATNCK